ncbi:MAG TPA: hypothetical protein VKT52_07945, partial [Ktedonobacterales bacterium]|nr:hypothetical protein [Ktedonobacterales bacterium]
MAVQNIVGNDVEAGAGIAPHGGRLIDRTLNPEEIQALQQEAQHLQAIRLTPRQESDLKLLSNGAYSPLEGFMVRADYERVLAEMHLSNCLPWSVPVTLAVDAA